MLTKPERLARRRDFAAVYKRKKSWANEQLVLHVRWHANNGENAETRRFGFSVSKKVGKAHDRNSVKRRLREICRNMGKNPSDGAWRQGFDAIFVARTGVAQNTYADLEHAVRELARKANLLSATKPVPPVSNQNEKEPETST